MAVLAPIPSPSESAAAGVKAGAPQGFVRRYSHAPQIGRVGLDMKAEFVGRAAFEPPPEQDASCRPQTAEHAQTSSAVARIAVLIAVVSRFHAAVSSRSRRRPAVVRV
jgi:hypothetical protein